MATTLAELARLVGGELVGDGDQPIEDAAVLLDASPTDVSLVDCAERVRELEVSNAAAVVVSRDLEITGCPAIIVDDVHAAFAAIVSHFRPPRTNTHSGISPQAVISSTAKIAGDVTIHPGVVIEDHVVIASGCHIHSGAKIAAGCQIAEEVTIFHGAVLYENTIVGPRSIIHANVVIGAYGFGYDSSSGRHLLSAQLGNVELGADVEIGAGTTIDRGTYGPTRIGEGTKIDNMVQIAHNCRIGRHNLICSQVGIAGSSTTGDYVVLGGQVGVRDHVEIQDGAILGAMSGVTNTIPAGEIWLGIPATPAREQKYKQGALSKLPEMRKQLRKLQKTVDKIVEEREAARQRKPPAAA